MARSYLSQPDYYGVDATYALREVNSLLMKSEQRLLVPPEAESVTQNRMLSASC